MEDCHLLMGKRGGKRWPKCIEVRKAASIFFPARFFHPLLSPRSLSVVRLARLTSRLRSTVHRVAPPVTSHLPPLPSSPLPPSCSVERPACGDLEGAGNSIRFTRPEMVTGPKLSDHRADSLREMLFQLLCEKCKCLLGLSETCPRRCFCFMDVLRP